MRACPPHLTVFLGGAFSPTLPGTGPGASSAEDHMSSHRALAVSAAAVAALGLAAPAAVARDGMNFNPSNIVALPSVIARGGQLTITVDGCPGGATATSDAFPSTQLMTVAGSNTARGT